MKSFIFLLFIILIANLNIIYTQTRQAAQLKMNYLGNTIYLDTHQDFKQNNFVLGWHWDGGYKMSQSLGINQIHVWTEVASYLGGPSKYLNPDEIDTLNPRIGENAKMIMNTPYVGNHWEGFNIAANMGIMYEPTYQVNLANPVNSFVPRKYDTTRYAFGFGVVRGYVSNDSLDPNYDRLQLRTSFLIDSLSNWEQDSIVLKEPWKCDLLTSKMTMGSDPHDDIDTKGNIRDPYVYVYNIYNRSNSDSLANVDWKGVNFYLSINLRRLNDNDVLINSDTLLAIKMPYITGFEDNFPRQYGTIKFDSIPSPNYDSTFSLPNGRGIIRKLIPHQGDTVIYITRAMLPRGIESERDITISLFFACDNLTDPLSKNHNIPLKGFPDPALHQNKKIDSLKIEVKYMGKGDIGIDWLSITTRPTRELSMGYFDNTLKNKIQECLDSVTIPAFTDKNIKPFRWYLIDEPGNEYWFTRNYYTKLFGKVFTFEGGEGTPQFMYYCDIPEDWLGQGGTKGWRTNPYMPYHTWPPALPDSLLPFDQAKYDDLNDATYRNLVDLIYNQKNLGWPQQACYDFTYDSNLGRSERDNLISQSNYETLHYNDFNYLQRNGINPTTYGGYGHGLQLEIEQSMYNSAFNGASNRYLFDTIPWWGQIWLDGRYSLAGLDTINKNTEMKLSSTFLPYNFPSRSLTGEEFRYFLDKILILGGKGIIVDGESEFPVNSKNIGSVLYPASFKLHHGQFLVDNLLMNNMQDWDFLKDNRIGSDYLDLNDTNETFAARINIDTVASNLHIDKNKYYVGRKSERIELKKVSSFIKHNEGTLLNLKFKAILDKGFQTFYTQDPNLTTNNILSKYINFDEINNHFNICTRPIERDTIGCYNCHIKPYYEQHYWTNLTLDSGFYDITLLAHNSDEDMQSTIYLGVQNRRTDPLVYITDQDSLNYNLPSYYHTGYNFIPTAEFDSLVNFGIAYTNPQQEDLRQFYNTLWWKRLGSREITIPFNKQPLEVVYYIDPYYGRRVCGFMMNYAVKVKELGYDMAEWYMQRPYNDKIWDASKSDKMKVLYFNPDTVNLVMKLLPGQGKILKVDYEYAFPSPSRDIGLFPTYCNQIEYLKPAVQYKGTICDSLINTRPLLSKGIVISLDVPIDMKYTHLPDNTQQASGISLPPCTSDDATMMTSNPPKIVARWENINGTSTMRYYMVWNGICYCDYSNSGGIYIGSGTLVRNVPCDSIHNSISSSEIVMDSVNRIVKTYSTLGFPTRDPNYIGVTTINASALRNYVSWDDAELGIGIGWMYPGDSLIRGTTYIPNVQMPGGELFTTLVNPEMNRYSRVDLGEDECALVFEGRKSATLDDSTNQLFYTRIKVDSLGNIVPFLPVMSCDMAYLMQKDITGRVSMISYGTTGTRHRNARIIRNVAKYQMPNLIDSLPGSLAIKMDRVIWEATDELGNSIVEYSGYDYRDTISIGQSGIEWKPYCYSAKIPTVIKAINGNVKSPSLAQGVMKDQVVINGLDTEIVKTYYNDSAMVMAFGVNDSLIYQIPQNFWTLTTGGEFSLDVIPNINELSGRGKDPVLPELMSVKDDSLYQYMRIFYTSDSSESKQSSQYFYKGINFNDKYNYFIGFSNKEGEGKWFSPIALLDTNGIQSPKINMYNQNKGQYIPKDTISTEWFTIGQIKGLNYLEQGNMISGYAMEIERQRDGKIWEITENKINSKSYKFHQKVFINGQNEKYRILWVKQVGIKRIEQLLIGNLPERMLLNMDGDEMLQKTGNVNEQIVDLNGESYATSENKLQILAYPNPAKEEIYVVAYLPQNEVIQGNNSEKMNIKLYNSMGQEVYTKEITAGQLVRIQTSNLENGAYFVKATLNNNNTTIPTATKSIIIQK